jgi:hypothetical protein
MSVPLKKSEKISEMCFPLSVATNLTGWHWSVVGIERMAKVVRITKKRIEKE